MDLVPEAPPQSVSPQLEKLANEPARATEMDVTMIGLQNAGKSSLLRVLAVCAALFRLSSPSADFPCAGWGVHHRVSGLGLGGLGDSV